jgi:hypothetical protein
MTEFLAWLNGPIEPRDVLILAEMAILTALWTL